LGRWSDDGAVVRRTRLPKTDKGEDVIRTVFEFAEWDCDLQIAAVEEKAAAAETEELPMIPVPFDLSILDDGAVDAPADQPKADVAAAVAAAETASNVNKWLNSKICGKAC